MCGAAPPAQGVGPAPWLGTPARGGSPLGKRGRGGAGGGGAGVAGGGGAPGAALDASLQTYQQQTAARQQARGNRPQHSAAAALAEATGGEVYGAVPEAAAGLAGVTARGVAAPATPIAGTRTAQLARAGKAGAPRSCLAGSRSRAGGAASAGTARVQVPDGPTSQAEVGSFLGSRAAGRVRARREERAAKEQTRR